MASRGLDDSGFAHTGGVEIDVGPFLRSFGLYIKVE